MRCTLYDIVHIAILFCYGYFDLSCCVSSAHQQKHSILSSQMYRCNTALGAIPVTDCGGCY